MTNREFLKKNLGEIKPEPDSFLKLCIIVEASWHKKLVKYVNSVIAPKPGKMNSTLDKIIEKDGSLRDGTELHKDYEVVTRYMYTNLSAAFGIISHCIECGYGYDAETNKETVVFDIISFNLIIVKKSQKEEKRIVSKSWKISSFKKQTCSRLNLKIRDYRFYTLQKDSIDENLLFKDIFKSKNAKNDLILAPVNYSTEKAINCDTKNNVLSSGSNKSFDRSNGNEMINEKSNKNETNEKNKMKNKETAEEEYEERYDDSKTDTLYQRNTKKVNRNNTKKEKNGYLDAENKDKSNNYDNSSSSHQSSKRPPNVTFAEPVLISKQDTNNIANTGNVGVSSLKKNIKFETKIVDDTNFESSSYSSSSSDNDSEFFDNNKNESKNHKRKEDEKKKKSKSSPNLKSSMFKKSDYHHPPKNKKGNDNYLDSSGSESDKHAKNKKPGFKFNIFRSKSNSSSPSKHRKIKKSKLIKTSDLSSSDSDSSESSSPEQNANLGYKTSTYSHRSVGISKAKSTPDIAKDALCRSDYDIRPLGLRNVGNTCFFNSVIQCIVRIPPLVNLFLSKRYKSNLNKRNRLSSGGEISNGFYDLLMRLSGNNPNDVRWIDPSKFRSVFVKFYSRFDGYDEQDAQEFLLSLIDGLHEDMNSARPSHLSGGECDPWAIFTAQNVSPIYDLFRGKTESKISCSKCKHISIVKEGFIALSLPLPGHRFGKVGVKLEECLTIYCADEVLDGSNKVMCEGCKRKTISKKKTTIEYSGQFLILCLKRFAEKNGKLTKNDIKVSYPSVLRADVFSKDGSSYKLIGCVYHLGSLDGGHYTSSAIDQNSGRWFYFNDSRVTPITEADAHRDSAYILFYQKI